MIRLLNRDYNSKELLEIAGGLLSKLDNDYNTCYTAATKRLNRIDANFFRQLIRMFKIKANEENKRPDNLF